jgi:hypothetical protein
MNDFKTILNTNPHIFVSELIEVVRDGYLVESSNRGYISDGVLKKITLYKDPNRVLPEMELGEFSISEYDTQGFISKLADAVACGAILNEGSLYWPTDGKKFIRGKLYLPAEYTKEQLSELDWAEFKDAVKPVAGTGRDRNLLLSRYLAATGQL